MTVMAKPKKTSGKIGRPKAEGPPRRPTLSIKSTEAWREWLGDLADHCHMPSTVVIDQALILYAEAHGFKKPMPKRTS